MPILSQEEYVPTVDDIETIFLCQGCQTAEEIAQRLADYVSQARQSIDMSIYSFHLCPEPSEILVKALKERVAAGVSVRICYDAGSQQAEIPAPLGFYHCDMDTADYVRTLGFPSRAIEGKRALMHHKYVVLDAGTPQAQVWTGSMNFTDESFSLQENNVIILRSQGLADLYHHDFEELWVDADLTPTGRGDSGEATLQYKGEPAFTLVNFSPGEGDWIDESLANVIERTEQKLTLACVVFTSSRLIRALQGLMQRNIPVEGVYDWTQMEGVKYQWKLVPANNWKIGAWEEIVQYANLAAKKTTPYTPTSTHDFMHNKIMVCDDVTVTGSYNFSRHAQSNAENILYITSATLAQSYRDYIGKLMQKYMANPVAPTAPPSVEQKAKTSPPAPIR